MLIEELDTIRKDYYRILSHLGIYGNIFHCLYQLKDPYFIRSEKPKDTLWVSLPKGEDEETGITLTINENYWNTQTDDQKAFCLCHEAIHILGNHIPKLIGASVTDAINIAADLHVNHLLERLFKFTRSVVDPENRLCWVDTIFENTDGIRTDGSMYYYLSLMQKQDNILPSRGGILDSHGNMVGNDAGGVSPLLESAIEVCDSAEEIEFIESLLGPQQNNPDIPPHVAGLFAGKKEVVMARLQPKIKKKWDTVIKRKCIRTLKQREGQVEYSWSLSPRRVEQSLPRGMVMPGERVAVKKFTDKDKVNLFFFLDTSGSCKGFAQRFWAAANSLNPKKFNMRLFCFDTKVYETTIKSGRLYGFGGTSFRILEDHISKLMRTEKVKYPDMVFVITDGYGDDILPKHPERWNWFLTPSNTKGHIKHAGNIYNLADFD